ncbi:MAG: hypothetical protein AB7Q01_08275 [Gammaproteobacteria bacterium]
MQTHLTRISTDAGDLVLLPAGTEDVIKAARRWPMGVVLAQKDGEPHGLNFQVGEEEAFGIKFQPPDTTEEKAVRQFIANLSLIAHALPQYLEYGHRGILLPCAYLKAKAGGRFESGVAFFASPYAISNDTVEDMPHEDRLGAGSVRMMMDFMRAITDGSDEIGIPVTTFIGTDVRPRLALGALGMPFMVSGADVLAIQHPLRPEYPCWRFARAGGFSEFKFAPMRPSAVPGPPNVPHDWATRLRLLAKMP